jgi:hypothetical protein
VTRKRAHGKDVDARWHLDYTVSPARRGRQTT